MGYSNAYPNTAIESFKLFLNESLRDRSIVMTDNRYKWIWSSLLNTWFVGFAIGTLIAVPLTDNLGRKSWLFLI